MNRKSIFVILLSTLTLMLIIFSITSCKAGKKVLKKITVAPKTAPQYTETDTLIDEPAATKTLKYEYQWLDSKDIPPIAIVIDDFGQIGGDLLQEFAELDSDITFAVLPDLPNTQKTAKLANIYGHEVILHIPMQAVDKNQNPGKTYIKTGMDKNDIKDIVNNFLDQVPQAIGANNHMGSGVTADYKTVHSVMEILDSKKLFFLDSRTSVHSKVVNAASDLRADYCARDIFLDVPDVSNATLNKKLQSLDKYRGRKEPVIIISHCHNQAKLEAMRSFVSNLKGMGIKLIPLSDAVNKFKLPT